MELQASMGLAQMNKLPQIHALRKRNHALLCEAFNQYESYFVVPKATDLADPSWFAFAVTIKDGAPFKRKHIVQYLENAKIQTRPYFAGNIMLQPAYSGIMSSKDVIEKYPVARKITTDTFFLGTSPVITEEQICYIKKNLDLFINNL
jgi:CDP-6-deoxy-D-xylo-4-hexulose-3-dehydrase